jgi:hypothetical protein
MEIYKKEQYTFKRQVGDGQFDCRTEDVIFDGEKVNAIIMAYINTITFDDTGFIKFSDGGGIINGEYFDKMLKAEYSPCNEVRAELKQAKELLAKFKSALAKSKK